MFTQNNKILLYLFFLFTFLLFSSVGQGQDDSLTTDEDYENYDYSDEDDENIIFSDSSVMENNIYVDNYTPSPSNDYYSKKIDVRKVDEEKWKSLTKDLNYSEEPEKEKTKPKKDNSLPSATTSISVGPVFQYILFGLVIAIIVFVLLRLIGVNLFTSNKSVNHGDTINIDRLDEELHESDLDRYLKDALNKKEFKLAIRIYYLMTLKELSIRNWIEWKKDKTNREYLYEMSDRENYQPFMELTRVFERTWYGDKELMESDYHAISPGFKEFIEGIRRTEA